MDEMKVRVDIAMLKNGEERAQALLHLVQTYDMSVAQRVRAVFEMGHVYLALGRYDEAHYCFHDVIKYEPARASEINPLVLQIAEAETNVAKSLALQAGLLAYIPDVSHYDDVVKRSFELHLPQIAERAWRSFRTHSNTSVEDILFQFEAESYGYQVKLDNSVPATCLKNLPSAENERSKKKFTEFIKRRSTSHIPEDETYFANVLECLDAQGYGTTDEEKQVKSELVLKYTILSDAVTLEDFKSAVQIISCSGNGLLRLVAVYSMMQKNESYRQNMGQSDKVFLRNCAKNSNVTGLIWADLFDLPAPYLADKTREEKMRMALWELNRISRQPETVVTLGYARMINDYITKLTQVRQ